MQTGYFKTFQYNVFYKNFNPFVPNAPFLYPPHPPENRKPYGFRVFSGCIERMHWEQMG